MHKTFTDTSTESTTNRESISNTDLHIINFARQSKSITYSFSREVPLGLNNLILIPQPIKCSLVMEAMSFFFFFFLFFLFMPRNWLYGCTSNLKIESERVN